MESAVPKGEHVVEAEIEGHGDNGRTALCILKVRAKGECAVQHRHVDNQPQTAYGKKRDGARRYKATAQFFNGKG